VTFAICLPYVCSAAAPGGGDEAAVAEKVAKMFKITSTATKLSSPAVEKIVEKGAAIYDVKIKVIGPDGRGIQNHKIKVLKKGDAITQFASLNTNKQCPVLQKMIRKDFKLKTQQDFKALEAALDTLYPISDSFGGRDKKAKAIIQKDSSVIFVRGEFFKKFKGFIFKTDKNGSIVNVSYSLGIAR
ncbi:MAG: hypothetical protein HN350_12115, partial [Phycisphaerales bacterium]|nr:hypothetical protein [Phycisphaerales bacterium]